VLRDRRSFANAVLLGLALALLALGTAERLARAHDAASRLVLLAVFALVAVAPLLVAAYLVVNGVTMLRRESVRPANLLSLLVGVGILAVIGFRLATPLTSSGELALSATIVMLLFGYVSFQCASFVLYAFLYGRLSVPRHADFVVVLGSGLLDGGRIPPLLASRLDRGHAVFRALAAHGSDPVLIVSGGKGGDEQVSEADAMAGYLAARGFSRGPDRARGPVSEHRTEPGQQQGDHGPPPPGCHVRHRDQQLPRVPHGDDRPPHRRPRPGDRRAHRRLLLAERHPARVRRRLPQLQGSQPGRLLPARRDPGHGHPAAPRPRRTPAAFSLGR
jgi:hypothetical protein